MFWRSPSTSAATSRQSSCATCDSLSVKRLSPVDGKDEFTRDYVAQPLAAQATYLGTYPVSASLSRPFMAKIACNIAKDHGCDAILHTATRSQNSMRRFNGSLADLGFQGPFGSPSR